MPDLNSRQFHGSRFAFLEPGDYIEPASSAGRQQFGYARFPEVEGESGNVYNREDRVFTTGDERRAWDFSEMTLMKSGPFGRVETETAGRPYVYEVELEGGERVAPKRGADDEATQRGEHAPGEHISARAKVIQRVDIPPPDVWTETFDEFELSPKNPTGVVGTTNEAQTARQGQLAGRGINWSNYDKGAWVAMDLDPANDPQDAEMDATIKGFTGMSSAALDAEDLRRWEERQNRAPGPSREGSPELHARLEGPMTQDPRQTRLF